MFSLPYNINFMDPASVYVYGIIHLHNNIFWYLILIVVSVFWVLFAILYDFLWRPSRNHTVNNFANFWIVLSRYVGSMFYPLVYPFIYSKGASSDSEKKVDFRYMWALNYEILSNIQANDIVTSKRSFKSMVPASASFKDLLDFNKLISTGFWRNYAYNHFYFNRLQRRFISPNVILSLVEFRHHTLMEFVWAIFPGTIVGLILSPSFTLMYANNEDIDPFALVFAEGRQWYWNYSAYNLVDTTNIDGFESAGIRVNFEFDSTMTADSDLNLGYKRLLDVDNPLWLPHMSAVKFMITSADVLHSFALPELGIKIDATPGRITQTVNFIRHVGTFFGQCSELCGAAHAFMPIVINVA